jgi:hypothetical protein
VGLEDNLTADAAPAADKPDFEVAVEVHAADIGNKALAFHYAFLESMHDVKAIRFRRPASCWTG